MRRFTVLTETAIKPQRATPGSAGYDLYADETVLIEPNETRMVKTGVTVELPYGEVALLHLRSSLAYKRDLMLANGVGVVDSDYAPNEIGVLIHNASRNHRTIEKGDKIAQIIIQKFETTLDDIPVSYERTGGFGSTGK